MASRLSPKILIAIALLIVGFAVLFGVGLRGSLVYYLTVAEFLDKHATQDFGENFRINGNVLEGSIEKPPSGLGARFVMSDGARQMRVTYSKETPDTFVDGSEVVVEGSLGAGGVFVAHTLLAKCPSKYEAASSEADYKTAGDVSGEAGPADSSPPSL